MLFDTRRTLGRRRATAGLDHGSLALARRAAPFTFYSTPPLMQRRALNSLLAELVRSPNPQRMGVLFPREGFLGK